MKSKKFVLLLVTVLMIFFVSSGCNLKDNDKKNPNENVPSSPGQEQPDEDIYTSDKVVTQTKLKTYDGPSMLTTSTAVTVKVEDINLFVYETRVNHLRDFSWTAPTSKAPVVIFDFEGEVEVELELKGTNASSAIVTPLEYAIVPTIANGKVKFKLNQPGNYNVEFNEDYKTAVHIFANPLETDAPDPENIPEDMIYIGPGLYKAVQIPVKSNQTLYISGGAVVYGEIMLMDVENVNIRGRGIIDASIYPRAKIADIKIPLFMDNVKNTAISDITILDSAGHSVNIKDCENIKMNNVKIITARANGDGISVQSSKYVTVNGGFVRSYDDSLVVKNYEQKSTKNITFNGTKIWTDFAQSMEVGYETYGDKMEDITFKNITVLHNFHYPAMSIHNADHADIKGVTFQNITIEDAQMSGYLPGAEDDYLIEMFIKYNSSWSSSGMNRGTISDVLFSNIKILNGIKTLKTELTSYSAEKNINNVVFQNINLYGKKIETLTDLNLTKDSFSTNVKIDNNDSIITGARTKQLYNTKIALETPIIKSSVMNIVQTQLIVPPSIRILNQVPYAGVKTVVDTFEVNKGKGSKVVNSIIDTADFDNPDAPASNLFDGDYATKWVNKSGLSQSDEFVALTLNFNQAQNIGRIRLYMEVDNSTSSKLDLRVLTKSTKSTATFKLQSTGATEYEISAAASNYADINLPSVGPYEVIQIRIYNTSAIEFAQIISLTEIELFAPYLSYKKNVTSNTAHVQEWDILKLTDGDDLSYYESVKTSSQVEIVVDLQSAYNIQLIMLQLPPKAVWGIRSQEIAISSSIDGNSYSQIKEKNIYTFDASKGNNVKIDISSSIAKFVKFTFYSNSENYGVQMSEIYIYGN